MNRAYLILVLILLAVVAAFIYAKVQISDLEARDTDLKLKIERKGLIDSLQTIHKKLLENETADLARSYDSLKLESDQLIYALESQLSLQIDWEGGDAVVGDSQMTTVPDDTVQSIEFAEGSAEGPGMEPEDYAVYIAYLESLLEFPKDLSAYERKVAIKELKGNLTEQFQLTKPELDSLLVKMRNRRSADSG